MSNPNHEVERPKLYATVCSKCGRQVRPSWDHNLGTHPYVNCGHGAHRGTEMVKWERIEVVPRDHAKAQALAEVREALESEEAVHILDSALFDFPEVHGGKITNSLRLLREFLSNALQDAEEEQ